MMPNKAVIISGPTASGKTALAEFLYNNIPECNSIINADSMQVYKELPLLTALPDLKNHHFLYSYKNFFSEYSLGIWYKDACHILQQIIKKVPIIVGGTGMYIKALTEGMINIPVISSDIRNIVNEKYNNLGKDEFYQFLGNMDASFLEDIKPTDKQRMIRAAEVYLHTGRTIKSFEARSKMAAFNFLHLTLVPDREWLYSRCNRRFHEMINAGVIEEVKFLNAQLKENKKKYSLLNACGYQEITDFLEKKIDFNIMSEKAKQKTRNYAKRQLTWFRHQPNALKIGFDEFSTSIENQVIDEVKRFIYK